jgi:hypothetical protein
MKKSELRKIIRETIKSTLKEAEEGCGPGGTPCKAGKCPLDGEIMAGGYVRKCHCFSTSPDSPVCCSCDRVKAKPSDRAGDDVGMEDMPTNSDF